MSLKRVLFFLILPLSAFLVISGCSIREPVRINGMAQGTYFAVTYYDDEKRDFGPRIDSILKAFDLSVSIWEPGSVISRINRDDTTVVADRWFLDIFDKSLAIAEETGGAFDPTVAPLVNAWGFGFEGEMVMDTARVDSLLQYVGFEKVWIEDGRVRKELPGIRLDFNAIAQGYSVDVISAFLESKGIENYLVDVGGEVYASGEKPGGKHWVVGIERPAKVKDDTRMIQTTVELKDMALATSGNYRKYYEVEGMRYSHSINPATGFPVNHTLLSVTVMDDNCWAADAYATAFMIMGQEKSLEFILANGGPEAYFITSEADGTFGVFATKGFQRVVREE